jgi:hypothetical protein
VIEIDSVEWHRFGETPEMTERRHARLAARGWTVLPVSPRRIREEPVAVLGEIEAAISQVSPVRAVALRQSDRRGSCYSGCTRPPRCCAKNRSAAA